MSRIRKFLRKALGRQPRQRRSELVAKYISGGVGAEIGVWKGEFSAELLRFAQPKALHLIDPWLHADAAELEQSVFGRTTQQDMDRIAAEVETRYRDSPVVTVHRSTSLDAAAEFPDNHFDWIYLDADHSYEAVTADLSAWSSKVRPGGLIVCDDYGQSGWWRDGVKRAFDEAVESGALTLVAIEHSQAIGTRPAQP